MTGEEFVKKAKEYFTKKKIEDIHGFGVTKLNPEKSKHLETATIKIKDKWVDFVNLRGETYGDSRVPEIVTNFIIKTYIPSYLENWNSRGRCL